MREPCSATVRCSRRPSTNPLKPRAASVRNTGTPRNTLKKGIQHFSRRPAFRLGQYLRENIVNAHLAVSRYRDRHRILSIRAGAHQLPLHQGLRQHYRVNALRQFVLPGFRQDEIFPAAAFQFPKADALRSALAVIHPTVRFIRIGGLPNGFKVRATVRLDKGTDLADTGLDLGISGAPAL